MLRALALCLLIAAVPPAWSAEPLSVVSTSTDLRALVEAVGGERVRVESLVSPGQDPHTVELRASQLARLKKSSLLVRIGLDHETWLARALKAARLTPGAPHDLDVSRNIRLLQTETPRLREKTATHVHGFGNTHFWLDPANARPITLEILEALSRLAPDDRPYFDANRTRFLQRLDVSIERWTKAMAPFHGTRVVVVHESWPYFAERFGLVVVAAIESAPGIPPSPSVLAALPDRMRERGVQILIAEPYSDPAVVRQVATRSGARVVTLVPSVGADPAARDYIALFDLNIARLTEALASGR